MCSHAETLATATSNQIVREKKKKIKGSERVTSNACVFQKIIPNFARRKTLMGDKKKALHCLHRIALRSSAHSLAPGEERDVQNAAPSFRLHTTTRMGLLCKKQLLESRTTSSSQKPFHSRGDTPLVQRHF